MKKLQILLFGTSFLLPMAGVGCGLSKNPAGVSVSPSATPVSPRSASTVTPTDGKPGKRIVPSTVLEILLEAKKQNAAITPNELADLGNREIARQGFNFQVNSCAIAESNRVMGKYFEEPAPFSVEFMDRQGHRTTYALMARGFDAFCGCAFDLPLRSIAHDKMTIVSDGSPIEVVRPKDYFLDEIELVDASLNRTIRKWYNHNDQPPLGISEDGKRVYYHTGYDDPGFAELALEVGEAGIPRFVSLPQLDIITNKVTFDNFPKDPNNSYLGYFRFKGKNTSYILKFSYPCT
ncbi:MAG: hypothetical protein ABIP75_18790 [Pyrinomonadaceae bacterium]